jgi:hypothetical protein
MRGNNRVQQSYRLQFLWGLNVRVNVQEKSHLTKYRIVKFKEHACDMPCWKEVLWSIENIISFTTMEFYCYIVPPTCNDYFTTQQY